jgi:hypothetical protein
LYNKAFDKSSSNDKVLLSLLSSIKLNGKKYNDPSLHPSISQDSLALAESYVAIREEQSVGLKVDILYTPHSYNGISILRLEITC